MNAQQFAKMIVGLGCRIVGSGHYADVYSHPTDPTRVIKIGHRKGDGWPAFAEYAINNPGPHVPVIHSFERFEGPAPFYVAEMERLVTTLCKRVNGEIAPRGAPRMMFASCTPRSHPCWST